MNPGRVWGLKMIVLGLAWASLVMVAGQELPPTELSKAEMARLGLTRAQMANAEMAKQQGPLDSMDISMANMASDKLSITNAAEMAKGGLTSIGRDIRGMMPGVPSQPVIVQSHGTIILNCTAKGRDKHVVWFRPGDGQQVSHDTTVIPSLRNRIRIVGDYRLGQFHLEIKYATFPVDNGTWSCSVFDGIQQAWDLMVLVPPAKKVPSVNPPIGIIYQLNAEAWTFACVAHYANPPVKLTWIRKSGPPTVTEFDAAPSKGVMASDLTISTSKNLILTTENHGSVFSCVAEHPTFHTQIYSTDVHFMIADPKLASGMPLPVKMPSRGFSAGKMGVILVFAFVFLLAFFSIAIMARLRQRWQLDIRPLLQYEPVPPIDMRELSINTTEMDGRADQEDALEEDILNPPARKDSDSLIGSHRLNGRIPSPSGTATDTTTSEGLYAKEKRKCIIKFAIGTTLAAVLLIAVGLIIPMYINGFPMPVKGVDAIVPVVAGSLLWLDCGELAMANDNLLQIGWRRNFQKFYNQYPNTHPLLPPVGHPTNVTEKYALGMRVQNARLGQIMVYPALPGDGGLYICESARMMDDTGRTSFQRKTFVVEIIMGVPINRGLIIIAGGGVLAALLLVAFGYYVTFRWIQRPHREGSEIA